MFKSLFLFAFLTFNNCAYAGAVIINDVKTVMTESDETMGSDKFGNRFPVFTISLQLIGVESENLPNLYSLELFIKRERDEKINEFQKVMFEDCRQKAIKLAESPDHWTIVIDAQALELDHDKTRLSGGFSGRVVCSLSRNDL